MARTVAGLFDNFATAEKAIHDLVEDGFERNDISVVANQYTGESTPAHASDSDMAGAAGTGAALGGVAGLLIGLGAMAIPGIGPILAAGPLAAALAGAGIGAAAGGIMGTLVTMGIPEEEAQHYAEGVRRGGALVTVRCDDTMADDAAEILQKDGAANIEERVAQWKKGESVPYSPQPSGNVPTHVSQPQAPSITTEPLESSSGTEDWPIPHQPVPVEDTDYQQHHRETYRGSGPSYPECAPAYRIGHELGIDRRYATAPWELVEPVARERWEQFRAGTWEQFRSAVREGWQRTRRRL